MGEHCHDGHCDVHHHSEEKESKVKIILYIISCLLFLVSFLPALEKINYLCYLVVIVLAGYDLILRGIKNIFKLNFEEDTLMTIAVIAAFILGEYPESCLVILLYKLGEFLEHKAVSKSKKNIEEIAKIKADKANVLQKDGSYNSIEVEQVKIEDEILIKPGEKVPVDCIVLEGESTLDTAAITGESKPIFVEKEGELLSGSININGALKCKVIREYKDSTASKIIDLVYEANNNKGKTEKFITKFSKIYTPVVIILALFIAIVPASIGFLDYKTWILRALVFLVASCPCSLVISVPLSFFACIGAISKKGMVIKGTKHIENLAKAKTIAFDKTGTLTTGDMEIDEIEVLNGYKKEEVLETIYSLEKRSNHPISTAILKLENDLKEFEVTEYEEIPGCGLYGVIKDKEVLFGNEKLLKKYNINLTKTIKKDAIYLCIDKLLAGYITLKETIKEDRKDIVKRLNDIGIKKVVMLTGDNQTASKIVSEKLKIKEVYSSLLPKDKLEIMKKLKKENKVIFVGDGINDSPVLVESDFGISIGNGTDVANSTSDGVLISNNINTIPNIILTAKKAMRIIRFNISFSLVVKAIVLVLGMIGIAPIWLAILADTGVSLLTVLNSLRIYK